MSNGSRTCGSSRNSTRTGAALPRPGLRRHMSMPPWYRPDIDGDIFLRENKDKDQLFVDDADINLQTYTIIREILRHPATVVLILDERFVLKMRVPTFDVEAIVNFMRLASTVVPVPHVYKYGHSGNCSFILMEYVRGHTLDGIKQYYRLPWISVMAPVEKQVEVAIQRLADVGLSHHDLYPRNILVNDSWEIIAIIDWDFCTAFDPGREYLRRLNNHVEEAAMYDREVIDPWHWDILFLRQVKNLQSLADCVKDRHLSRHDPPLLRCPRSPVVSFPIRPPSSKPRLVTQNFVKRRIAVMTSNAVSAVKALLEACTLEQVPHTSICCLFSYESVTASPLNGASLANLPFNIIHLPPFPEIYDDWDYRWQHYYEDVTRRVLRECPDVIIQVGWTLALEQPLLKAMTRPRIVQPGRRYKPVPLVWIQPHLPDAPPGDLSSSSEWAYNAFQRGEIIGSGFTVSQLMKTGFRVHHTHRVALRKEERLDEFQARMLEVQDRVIVKVANEFLHDVEPIAC